MTSSNNLKSSTRRSDSSNGSSGSNAALSSLDFSDSSAQGIISSGTGSGRNEIVENKAREKSKSLSLFGFHGVNVMPRCNESDGTFFPPLVSFCDLKANCCSLL